MSPLVHQAHGILLTVACWDTTSKLDTVTSTLHFTFRVYTQSSCDGQCRYLVVVIVVVAFTDSIVVVDHMYILPEAVVNDHCFCPLHMAASSLCRSAS